MEWINVFVTYANFVMLIIFISFIFIIFIIFVIQWLRIKWLSENRVPSCDNCNEKLIIIQMKKFKGMTNTFWNIILGKYFCKNCARHLEWVNFDKLKEYGTNDDFNKTHPIILLKIKKTLDKHQLNQWDKFSKRKWMHSLGEKNAPTWNSSDEKDFYKLITNFAIDNLIVDKESMLCYMDLKIFKKKYKNQNIKEENNLIKIKLMLKKQKKILKIYHIKLLKKIRKQKVTFIYAYRLH